MSKYARVSITLPEEMLTAVDRRGVREMRNRSEVIREALRHYLRLGLTGPDDSDEGSGRGAGGARKRRETATLAASP